MLPKTFPIILDYWTDFDRETGSRPDGCSVHLSPADHKAFVDAYNAKHNSRPDVPCCYSVANMSPKVIDAEERLYYRLHTLKAEGKPGLQSRGRGDEILLSRGKDPLTFYAAPEAPQRRPVLRPTSALSAYGYACMDMVFLAGPIQGAPDWQSEAVDLLQAQIPDLLIANPRVEPWHGDFDAQVEWEHKFLARASIGGVTMFWLAREVAHDPSRAYAQTTRFELGEALANVGRNRNIVVVGIEPGFSGERYIRKTIADKYPAVPVRNTLAETCRAVVEHLRGPEAT